MTKGFKATLFAGVMALGVITPAFAAAPVISGLPDVAVGDAEDAGVGGSDTNVFQFSNAFKFSDYVSDADTPAANLKWSFGEFDSDAGLPTPEYSVNGKSPVNVGTTAIADDEAAGNVNAKAPGSNQLNTGADYASFRDILFSPGNAASYPAPDGAQAVAASAGKLLRFYVSDPDGNVTSQTIVVSSLDNQFDSLTQSDGFQQIYSDSDLTSSDWVKSGIDSGPGSLDPTGPDDVNVTSAPGTLSTIVSSIENGRYWILGWQNPVVASYDEVGAANYLHGKFYIYTSNASTDADNQVPGFRIRLQQEGAVLGQTEFSIGQTGQAAPQEPLYQALENPAAETRVSHFLRPSNNAAKPSAYSVDFDPVDVPAAAGTDIWATFESFAVANPAAATLSVTQVDVSSYHAKTDEGTLLWAYDPSDANTPGGVKRVTLGAFNAENNFVPGRRQQLFISGEPMATSSQNANGIVLDTTPIQTDRFGIGLATLDSATTSLRPRIATDKLYRVRFYVTSDMPTSSEDSNATVQGAVRLDVQTGIGVVNSYMDISGPQNTASPNNKTKQIAVQALPGSGNANPDTSATLATFGESGGWYSVLLPSPLNNNGIRADNGNDFGNLGAEPGYGSNDDSAKDIVVGVDAIKEPTTLVLAPGADPVPFNQSNVAKVHVRRIEISEYPAIDDGVYPY